MGNIMRLENGKEFTLVGSGYARNPANNTIQFALTSEMDIGAIQSMFKDEDAISIIDIVLPDGTTREAITDCLGYHSLSQDASGKYLVTLSTDKALLQKRLKSTQEALAATQETLEETRTTLETTQETLSDAQTALMNANGVIDALSNALVTVTMQVMM